VGRGQLAPETCVSRAAVLFPSPVVWLYAGGLRAAPIGAFLSAAPASPKGHGSGDPREPSRGAAGEPPKVHTGACVSQAVPPVPLRENPQAILRGSPDSLAGSVA